MKLSGLTAHNRLVKRTQWISNASALGTSATLTPAKPDRRFRDEEWTLSTLGHVRAYGVRRKVLDRNRYSVDKVINHKRSKLLKHAKCITSDRPSLHLSAHIRVSWKMWHQFTNSVIVGMSRVGTLEIIIYCLRRMSWPEINLSRAVALVLHLPSNTKLSNVLFILQFFHFLRIISVMCTSTTLFISISSLLLSRFS